MTDQHDDAPKVEVPPLGTFWSDMPYNALSGFLVFLIALPLCLAISTASGYPPLAGVFTAILGGIFVPLFSNSELTIKGPAAGLIAVAIMCVQEFGFDPTGTTEAAKVANMHAYQLALGVGFAAGVLQILFALCKAGRLGEFFPTSTVHGMLAAIGIMIIAKQTHILFGQKPPIEALHAIMEFPHTLLHANWPIAVIGLTSLVIMFGWSFVTHPQIKLVPAPLLVLLVAVPLGLYFDLDHQHKVAFFGGLFDLGPKPFLVDVDPQPFSIFSAIAFPDFSGLQTLVGWKYVIMFSLVGTLETLLSAQAIDLLDPWHRKTDLNNDLLMVGILNTVTACIGGLPMISEIVRSKANIDAGARSRMSNVFHGLFLFGFVAFLPFLIHEIPTAALAAMLVYTGFRLASPMEFVNTFLIGIEQLAIFITTIVVTLWTDLLIGIAAGIFVKLCIHLYYGVPLRSLFLPVLDVIKLDEHKYLVEAKDSAVFTNWLAFKAQLIELGLLQNNNLVVDMSGTVFVDHTVMENLHTLSRDFELNGLTMEIIGFDDHQPMSSHHLSARSKSADKLGESKRARELKEMMKK